MWSQWKDKIESANANILESVAKAVAPEDGEDDEYYDDDEYDDDEDEDEEDNGLLPKSPFALIGRLTQALDRDQEEYEDEEAAEEEYAFDDGGSGEMVDLQAPHNINNTNNAGTDPALIEEPASLLKYAASTAATPLKAAASHHDDWGDDSPAEAPHTSPQPQPTVARVPNRQRMHSTSSEGDKTLTRPVRKASGEDLNELSASLHQQDEATNNAADVQRQLEQQKREEAAAKLQRQRQDAEEKRNMEEQKKQHEAMRLQKEQQELQRKQQQERVLKAKREEEMKRMKEEEEKALRVKKEKEAQMERQRREAEMNRQKAEALQQKKKEQQEDLRKKQIMEKKRQQQMALEKQKQQQAATQAPGNGETAKARSAGSTASNNSTVQKKAPSISSARPIQKKTSTGSVASASSAATSKSQAQQRQLDQHQKKVIVQQEKQLKEWEVRYKAMEDELAHSKQQMQEMQQASAKKVEETVAGQEDQLVQFQQKEARLLEAQAEDHQMELNRLQEELLQQMSRMQESHQEELDQAMLHQQEQMQRLLGEANARADQAEKEKDQAIAQQQRGASQQQQHQTMLLRRAEDQLAQSMAVLDEREEEIVKLNQRLADLHSDVKEHHAGAEEAEEELDELHTENETLKAYAEKVGAECARLKTRVDELEHDSEQLSGLKMELRMLKEKHARESTKIIQKASTVETNHAQIEYERDEALREVQTLQQQLAACEADLQVAKSDGERIMQANENLQSALESFQSEREAEMALIEEQRVESEGHLAAAHEASMDAFKEVHKTKLREVQAAADNEIQAVMLKVQNLEGTAEEYRLDNVQMRRSLDEAIHRLQATQDDVIDRTVIKNILLDWLTKTDANKKRQVLELMANLLHFTDEEKSKVHIQEGSELVGSLVHAVAAPLPPPKADMEHLEGDNVREQWVSFLMGETDDD